MIRKPIILRSMLIVISLAYTTTAQAGALCGYGSGGAPGADLPPTPAAIYQMKVIENKLCSRFSCPQYSFAQSFNTQNAMAWSNGYSNSIRYNSSFLNRIFHTHGDLASGAIFAHELGHLIDFNQRQNLSRRDLERRADEYAGCAFALTGHPVSDLIPMQKTLLLLPSSEGYPSPAERVQAVTDGYKKCKS